MHRAFEYFSIVPLCNTTQAALLHIFLFCSLSLTHPELNVLWNGQANMIQDYELLLLVSTPLGHCEARNTMQEGILLSTHRKELEPALELASHYGHVSESRVLLQESDKHARAGNEKK